MEYKARGYDGGSGSSSSKGKKLQNKAAKVVKSKAATSAKAPAFNGVLTLSSAGLKRFYACMKNPGAPTESIRKGDQLLRSLYKNR